MILEQEPNEAHNYCSVCKLLYENYFTHLTTSIHKTTCQNFDLYNNIDNVINGLKGRTEPQSTHPRRGREINPNTEMTISVIQE